MNIVLFKINFTYYINVYIGIYWLKLIITVRAENKKRTISKILESFYGLIQEKDCEKISIRDIKNKAKVSIGAIYHHFPQGKEDILHEMIKTNRDKILNLDLFNNISESYLESSTKTTC